LGSVCNMHPYEYVSSDVRFQLRLKETRRQWVRYLVAFPSAHPTRYQENNTVLGEYFVPCCGGHFPLAILLHGLGDMSVIPCRMLAGRLAKKGIASFILYQVFHSRRTPEAIKGQILTLSAGDWLEVFQISVIDVRQIIDWASGRVEIDDQQVAVFGISLGGIVSAIAMGVDERIRAGVFMVAGGNLEEITWGSKSHLMRQTHDCTQEECYSVYRCYPQYLADVAQEGFENVTPLKECFLYDPMTFASSLCGRPMLMFNALWDGVIPKWATLDFWEACRRPPIVWLPASHLTIHLWYPLISRKTITFLQSTFGMGAKPLHS